MIHERKFPALVIRYVEAAVEKPAINRQKSMVFAVLAQVSDGMANVQTPVSQF